MTQNATAAPKPRPKLKYDQRFTAPILITCILFGAQISFGIFEDYSKILWAIAASMLTEVFCGKFVDKKWPHLASAYVTGISVGIIVQASAIWPYVITAVLSTMSKYVIRVDGKHPWNPSNFGISAMLLLAPSIVSTLSIQWGNSSVATIAIWVLGSIIIWRLKRFHICASYAASFVVFAWLRALIEHQTFTTEVAPITGPPYQLFILFMITDPKSTVHPRWAQCLVAFCVAAMEFVLRLSHNVGIFHYPLLLDIHEPYFALTIVGPIAMLTEIYNHRKKAAEKLPATPTAAVSA